MIIQDTLAGVEPGDPITFRNLTMFPLQGTNAGAVDYITLDEALALGKTHVTEVSEGGSVPELRFINECDTPVFLMDGEEVVGAKQNRTLNISILAPAHSTILLPVTCVEAGRWERTDAEFAASPRAHYAAGRAKKQAKVSQSLGQFNTRFADQSEVWADIDSKADRLAASSETQAMGAIFDQYDTGIEEFVQAFSAQPGQRGSLFAINGEIIGFDLFDDTETLSKLLPKIIRSYALDAIDGQADAKSVTVPPEIASSFLKAAGNAMMQSYPALGYGEDYRLHADGLTGGGLVVDERVVHLSVFAATSTSPPTQGASMRRASQRRQSVE